MIADVKECFKPQEKTSLLHRNDDFLGSPSSQNAGPRCLGITNNIGSEDEGLTEEATLKKNDFPTAVSNLVEFGLGGSVGVC